MNQFDKYTEVVISDDSDDDSDDSDDSDDETPSRAPARRNAVRRVKKALRDEEEERKNDGIIESRSGVRVLKYSGNQWTDDGQNYALVVKDPKNPGGILARSGTRLKRYKKPVTGSRDEEGDSTESEEGDSTESEEGD